MVIGLYIITPSKLAMMFPEIGYLQWRLAKKLYAKLGKVWIEKAREAYTGVGRLAGYRK